MVHEGDDRSDDIGYRHVNVGNRDHVSIDNSDSCPHYEHTFTWYSIIVTFTNVAIVANMDETTIMVLT